MSEPHSRVRRGRFLKVLPTALAIAVVAGAVVFLYWANSGPARLRAKLKGRGFKLSVAELKASRTGSPRDLHELVEASQELRKLNFPELAGEFHLMNPGSSAVPACFIKSERPFWAATDTNLSNKSWGELAEALAQARPALERIRALAGQKIPEDGLGDNTPVFDFIQVAFWLAADAMSAAHQQSDEQALADLESLIGLAQIGSREKSHIAQIGRTAVIAISVKTTWELLQSDEWTDSDLRRMERAWLQALPLEAVQAAAESELASVDEQVKAIQTELAKAPFQQRLAMLVGLLDRGDDAQFLLGYYLAYWEAARALREGQPWSVLQPGLQQLTLKARSRRQSRYRHLALRRSLAGIDSTFEASTGCEAARQLLLTDMAIRRFKLQHHGSPPKTIQQLKPDFLGATSGRDVFGAGYLKYRAGQAGGYLLYSVGKDGADDGGAVAFRVGTKPFWDWRDIVWSDTR